MNHNNVLESSKQSKGQKRKMNILSALSNQQMYGGKNMALYVNRKLEQSTTLFNVDLQGHDGSINSLKFSSGGRYLASGSYLYMINIVNYLIRCFDIAFNLYQTNHAIG